MNHTWKFKLVAGTALMVIAMTFMAVLPLGCAAGGTNPISGIELYDDDYGEIIESTQQLRGKIDHQIIFENNDELADALLTDDNSTET